MSDSPVLEFVKEVQRIILAWRADTEAEYRGKSRNPEEAPFDDPHFKAMFFVQSAFLTMQERINPSPHIEAKQDGQP